MVGHVILFAPLASAVFITLFGLKRPKLSAFVSLAGILLSLALTVAAFMPVRLGAGLSISDSSDAWIKVPGLLVQFGFLIDPLSLLMLLIVTGVGSCIFLYSMGYMKDDPSYARYFASLSLF